MFLSPIAVALYLIGVAICAPNDDVRDAVTTDSVREAFVEAGIVPHVIPVFEPSMLLDVTFPDADAKSGDPSFIVEPGMSLSKDQVRPPPTFSISAYGADDAKGPYVALLVDPDAITPDLPILAQVCPLLAGNLTGDESREDADPLLLLNTSAPIVKWRHPIPVVGPEHRYIVLLYEQPDNFTTEAIAPLVNAPLPVVGFEVSEFARATGLGDPVAGTYFMTGPNAST
ncbi:phosphatidylethanolamine-binding protein [Schizophyllum fasciatum]